MTIPFLPYRHQARFARAVLIVSAILAVAILTWLVIGSLGGGRVWFERPATQTSAESAR